MSRVRENRMHGSTGGNWKRGRRRFGYRRWAPAGNCGDERRAYSAARLPRQFPTLPLSSPKGQVPTGLSFHTVWRVVRRREST